MPSYLDVTYRHFVPRQQPMYHRVFRAENIAVRDALVALRIRFHECVNDDIIGRLELALAEILNNICEHGGIALSLSAATVTEAAIRGERREPPLPLTRPQNGAPTIHLCVIQQAHGLACAVTDDGVPLPEDCLLPFGNPTFSTYRSREDPSEELPEGGFGWFLIQDLTKAMCYYREDQRNFLAFTIPFIEAQMEATAAQSSRDAVSAD